LPIALGAAFLWIATAAAQTILPPPPTPAGNPTTPNKALLGKALFWDEQLSSSRTMACGTCH
jgi:cytochrome c peroxidase